MLAALVLVVAATGSGPPPWQTGESRGEDLAIRIITFGPGDSLLEWFGHGAIVVQDLRLFESRLYNYGEFAFDASTIPRYAAGHLTFHVGERPVERTYALYARLNRDVRIQELALPPAQKLFIAKALTENAKPENRDYLYDHYLDNCTTRVRDVIDKAIGGQLKASTVPGRMTLRGHTRSRTAHSPVLGFGIDLLENDSVDRPITTWEEAFLPAELESQLAHLTVTDPDGAQHPIVASSSTWFQSDRPTPPEPPATWIYFVSGAAAAIVLLLLRNRRPFKLLVAGSALLAGIPGTVLFMMACFTDHSIAYWNENLFLVNPLSLLLVPLAFTRFAKPLSLLLLLLGLLGLVLKVVPAFDQDNTWQLAFYLPLLGGLAASHVLRKA